MVGTGGVEYFRFPRDDDFRRRSIGQVVTDLFAKMMDTERRLVIEVKPEKWITFDAAKMMAASIEAWREDGLLD